MTLCKSIASFAMLIAVVAVTGCTPPVMSPGASSDSRDLTEVRRSQADILAQIKQLRDNQILLEARLRDQEQVLQQLQGVQGTQKVTSSGEKAGSRIVTTPQPATSGESAAYLAPTEIYLSAFADYASGKFDRSVKGFRSFLQLFPNNPYAGNAQFWLGECFFAQEQWDESVQEFAKVVEIYPNHSKAPEALLKMASALQRMNQADRARDALDILQQRYPDSSAAQKAKGM